MTGRSDQDLVGGTHSASHVDDVTALLVWMSQTTAQLGVAIDESIRVATVELVHQSSDGATVRLGSSNGAGPDRLVVEVSAEPLGRPWDVVRRLTPGVTSHRGIAGHVVVLPLRPRSSHD